MWGDERLLWDSGPVVARGILKPRIDIRGVHDLSLRAIASSQETAASWAEALVTGYEGDRVVAGSSP